MLFGSLIQLLFDTLHLFALFVDMTVKHLQAIIHGLNYFFLVLVQLLQLFSHNQISYAHYQATSGSHE